MSKLLLYTDNSLISDTKTYHTILFPFWGNPESQNIEDVDFGRFDEYTAKGSAFFTLIDEPKLADYFLLPFEYSFENKIQEKKAIEFAKEAQKFNKKIIVFFNSDSTQSIPIDNAIIFRTSFYRSKRIYNEFAIPGWSTDLGNNFTKKDKPIKPKISYCGYVDYLTLIERIRSLYTKIRSNGNDTYIGPQLRGKAVRKILKDKRIESNFIIRKGFWAKGLDKKVARNEYVNNLKESDYALVIRGAGNFSYRLYEVLSCGKIPVFIDTDCVLPFDHIIDWKKYVIWIDQSEIDQLPDILCDFHDSLTNEKFNEMQRNARVLYENWVSPTAFFKNLYQCLK